MLLLSMSFASVVFILRFEVSTIEVANDFPLDAGFLVVGEIALERGTESAPIIRCHYGVNWKTVSIVTETSFRLNGEFEFHDFGQAF